MAALGVMSKTTRGRQTIIPWLSVALATATILILFFSNEIAASFRRHRLSRLLKEMKVAYAEGRRVDGDEARLALQNSGPDGLHWLAAQLEQQEGTLHSLYRKVRPHLPAAMQNRLSPPSDPRELHLEVVNILATFGPEAAQFFTNYLDDSEYALETRQLAYRALAQTGNRTSNVIATLARQTNSTNLADRVFAASAYAKLDSGSAERAVNVLTEVLLNRLTASSNERLWAANYLVGIGPEATNAITALEQAADDPDPYVRSMAIKSLRIIRKRFFEELRGHNKNGPANGSQPIRSETNTTSSAAGSRR